MQAKEIRNTFLEYFRSKDHQIVQSAPIVTKNDPTLMFTNAGMNQFKDFFLGHQSPPHPRIADTQKCLRVSGKHNDLEEVGRDSYHHTMFEMLGNWSFGDYFKNEAIDWAWDLLVNVFGLAPDRLYATVFGGDEEENLEKDHEAAQIWEKYLPKEQILYFGKKDNFWEMGDTGPCGPCSEIHIDIRPDAERKKLSGDSLVNQDNPLVIEIWNLVFIQYNRKADGQLENLPEKHVDTGMGFERLCMAIQGKDSNYDTDVFTPFIQFIEKATGIKYTAQYDEKVKTDIAMRVAADHVRAISFSIADGQLPGNTGAGYVIRRILRRAVRYYYSFLGINKPFLNLLVPLLAEQLAEVFPELKAQEQFVQQAILEEEKSFLHTLSDGLKRIEGLNIMDKKLSGKDAFELYDTYGFPIDLTRLIAAERGWEVDESGFSAALSRQRARSKADAVKETGDWIQVQDVSVDGFIGYDTLVNAQARIAKYRKLIEKGQEKYQIILDKTPFYAEGGGQVGDIGIFRSGDQVIKVLDTVKENDISIHIVNQLPKDLALEIYAEVDGKRRSLIENNHTATHLLHAALRQVLGNHVVQKGSLLNDQYLRFDFSHFKKVTVEELQQIEEIVNQKIRQNIGLEERRSIPIEEAKAAGAHMFFGEKYGEKVRMITFDPSYSKELCGGCHVPFTGKIGLLKITHETAVAAGVRRIEAVTADAGEKFVNEKIDKLSQIEEVLRYPQNPVDAVQQIAHENKALKKKVEQLQLAAGHQEKSQLKAGTQQINGINFLGKVVKVDDSKVLKTLVFELEKEIDNAVVALGASIGNKAQLMIKISQSLISDTGLHAGDIIREVSSKIQGGGGGQPFFASAGGKSPQGLPQAIASIEEILQNVTSN